MFVHVWMHFVYLFFSSSFFLLRWLLRCGVVCACGGSGCSIPITSTIVNLVWEVGETHFGWWLCDIILCFIAGA